MTIHWLDSATAWNPQLFRELKGRLKRNNILVTIGSTLLAQWGLMELFQARLGLHDAAMHSPYWVLDSQYDPVRDALGNPMIDWQHWWLDIFRLLNWSLPLLLIVPAVYLLIADLEQEERRGTLNFIRLSPQSSRSILLGKVLGVPVLLYLATLLVVPLHLVAAAGAQAPIAFTASYYLLLLAGSYLLFSAGLLCAFFAKPQTIQSKYLGSSVALAFMLLTLFVFLPLLGVWSLATVWSPFGQYLLTNANAETSKLQWFFLPLSSWLLTHTLMLVTAGLLGNWIWQAIDRCFHTPNATLFSKRQSYGFIAFLQILTVGFCLQNWDAQDLTFDPMTPMVMMALINLPVFLLLIGCLSNSRQTLLDWARYRHVEASKLRHDSDRSRRSTLLRDLIWGEKSPALAAIGLNLLIVGAVFLPWVLAVAEWRRLEGVLWLVILLSLIAIYAAIAQVMMLSKSANRGLWAGAAVITAMLVPAIVGGLIATSGNQTIAYAVLLFSPFAWLSLHTTPSLAQAGMIGSAILGQWLVLVLLTLRFTQQINRLGASASKALLTSPQ